MANESTNIELLVVPNKYKDLFNIFKEKLIKYAEDLIKDCTARNKDYNIDMIECWHMFQAACYAVSIGDDKLGNFYYNYIITKMKLKLNKITTNETSE
uniref:Uncharacterized protein n=1 Tax=Geladintestivirus 1 TaxID=3233133 RepID=A0AAU8MI30_9CAUD